MMPTANPLAPEIFDVTVRDGSYTIDFQFEARDVGLLCGALDRAGLRYIEVGHGQGLNASNVNDRAAATDAEYLAAAAENCTQARFGAFFIPGIADNSHLRWARETYGMHFVRIGSEPEHYERMLPFLEYAKSLGYEVMCNFMKTYCEPAASVARKSARLAQAGADAIYVVDSAGGMLPDEVGEYCRAISEHTSARIGFHGHNNLELAVSNSISAWRNGATLIDCSIGGLGRSSGNTRTELFIPVLKSLGVASTYDYQAVLDLWEQTIRPINARRQVSSQEIVGGYARIHSGLMKPFLEAAKRHDVDIVSLLDAYGDALHGGNPSPPVDELAAKLSRPRIIAVPTPSKSILRYSPPADAELIQNTFQSCEDALAAVRVLALKASLPVVGLIDIAPSEEPYAVAEYLYHDDHFIVVRCAFGSVASFVELMHKHPDSFDVLMFDERSSSSRAALASCESAWHHQQAVFWTDIEAAKYQTLFASVYHALGECDGRKVLFLGSQPERLARFAPPTFDKFALFSQSPRPQGLSRLNTALRTVDVAPRSYDVPESFDLAVVLAPISAQDLEPLVAQVRRPGLLLNCVSVNHAQHDWFGLEVRSVSLWRAVTGVLLNLMAKPEPAVTQHSSQSQESRRVQPARAA